MTESTCATCKHWDHPRTDFSQVVQPEWSADRSNFDERYAASKRGDMLYGHCGAVQMGPADAGEPLPLALVLDGSEYKADLYTSAEFGCGLHARG